MRKILDIGIGILIGLVVGGAIWLTASPPRGQDVTLRPAPTAVPIVVEVRGSVPRPGIYELPEGSRVRDAVEAAGGFLLEAEQDKVNLVKPLEDGQQLIIPGPTLEGQEGGGGEEEATPSPEDEEAPEFLVEINTATAEEFESLPGIGPTLAQQIVEYRDENGPFASIEDLLDVPGVSEATFELFMEYVYVSEE